MPDDSNQGKNLDDPVTWKEEGNQFFNKGQYEEAIKCYSHAVELNPEFIEAWNNLGLSLLKLGKIEEAKKCNEKVKEIKEKAKSQKKVTPIHQTPQKTQETTDKEYCQNCGEELPYKQGEWPTSLPKICPSCGVRVKDPIRYGGREGQGRTHIAGLKNPLLAAILSIIPGLGQVYNGQIIKGVIFLIGTLIGAILIIPGIIIWAYGIYHAYKTAKQMNYGDIPFKSFNHLHVFVFLLLVLVLGIFTVGVLSMNSTYQSPNFLSQFIPGLTTSTAIVTNGNEILSITVPSYNYTRECVKCSSVSYPPEHCETCDVHLKIDIIVKNVGSTGIKTNSLDFSLLDYAGFNRGSKSLTIRGMYPGEEKQIQLNFNLGNYNDVIFSKYISNDITLKGVFGNRYQKWIIRPTKSTFII